ncbi:hypothetical protein [Petroclostridium sp. X23]|uniref:hypothetical protein n=1 Tax=Petroclostridium sp. X23 TaxID=3045146 RepID=UPI0024AD2855|nr:hypothetical protein [Petroclostridium sp. X23]WHH58439.1 hypothetical protein QKW49_21995 [Petroclostridium sp. X23]
MKSNNSIYINITIIVLSVALITILIVGHKKDRELLSKNRILYEKHNQAVMAEQARIEQLNVYQKLKEGSEIDETVSDSVYSNKRP